MAGYSVTFTVVDQATRQIDAINRRIAQMRAPMERMSRQVSRFVDVSGLRKVAQGFEWIGKAAAGVFRSLSAIVPVMGAITGAASIAGMLKLVSTYASWSHELVQTADNIGITTDELQKLQNATRLAGGNADDMSSSLKSLHDNLSDMVIGRGNAAETAQILSRLGISARDATGHIRSAGDIISEVIPKIAALSDPADRARVATGLLGAEGDKLVETFRQSSQSFSQWFSDASRYKSLTDEQKRSLQQFGEAQGRVGVAFDQMGQQISVVIARDFGPLLAKFAAFVEKHTPDIVKALDELSRRFAAWLDGIKWDDVEAGIDKFIASLKWVWDHLDSIKRVAEGIAITFAVAWGVGMVANIAAVVAALAPLSAALAPITAALALIATPAVDAAIKGVEESEAKKQGFEKRGGSSWNPFDKIPHWVNPKTGETLTEEEMRRRLGVDPGRGFSPFHLPDAGAQPAPPATSGGWLERGAKWLFNRAIKGPDAIQPPTTGALPGDTSWGDYGTRANNPGNLNYADWEGASGKFAYTDPHTGGAHTMATFASMPEGIAAAVKLMQRNQAKYGATLAGALHGWAENPYVNKLGMDPNASFDVSKADPKVLSGILASQFKMEGRKGTHSATEDQILAGIQLARNPQIAGPQIAALPAALMPPARPAADVPFDVPARPTNSTVDVSITHKNAPPNSAVTATGSGSVNVNPVRVEHQDMASI